MPLPVDAPHVVASAHSSVSMQVRDAPLPELLNPAPHPQVKLPAVFAQVLTADRFRPHAVATPHSFTSTQVAESPLPCAWKPVVQPQV